MTNSCLFLFSTKIKELWRHISQCIAIIGHILLPNHLHNPLPFTASLYHHPILRYIKIVRSKRHLCGGFKLKWSVYRSKATFFISKFERRPITKILAFRQMSWFRWGKCREKSLKKWQKFIKNKISKIKNFEIAKSFLISWGFHWYIVF